MKKLLSVMTGITVFFAFTMTANGESDIEPNRSFAQYYNCLKSPPGSVDYPTERMISNSQGEATVIEASTSPFDFDGNPHIEGGFGTYGYCSGYNPRRLGQMLEGV
jgi:hypothetical protein